MRTKKMVIWSKLMLFAYCFLLLPSCNSEDDKRNESKVELTSLTIKASYSGANPIGWSLESKLPVYSYAKSSDSYIFSAQMAPDGTNSVSFTGELPYMDGDILYAVYPALSESTFPSQIPFDLNVQDEHTASIFTSTTLYTASMNNVVEMKFEEQLARVNFRLKLVPNLDLSTLHHISLTSTDIYTLRYLDITKGKPYWSGGKKTTVMRVMSSADAVITGEESADEVYIEFTALVFPSQINGLTIRLENQDDMILYSRNLTEINMELRAGETVNYPEIEYMPGNPNNQGDIDDVENNGELFE